MVPKLNVQYVYSINARGIKGLMVVAKPGEEMLSENMVGAAVDFQIHNGQIVEAPVKTCLGFEGNLHLFFENLTKVFKPLCFSDPEKKDVYDTDSVA